MLIFVSVRFHVISHIDQATDDQVNPEPHSVAKICSNVDQHENSRNQQCHEEITPERNGVDRNVIAYIRYQ